MSRPGLRLPPLTATPTGFIKAPISAAASFTRSIRWTSPWNRIPPIACSPPPTCSPGTASCPRAPKPSPLCTRPSGTKPWPPVRPRQVMKTKKRLRTRRQTSPALKKTRRRLPRRPGIKKNTRRQKAKVARKNQRILRKKLRHEKDLLQETNLFAKLRRQAGICNEEAPAGRRKPSDSRHPRNLVTNSSPLPIPCIPNPEPKLSPGKPVERYPCRPDHCSCPLTTLPPMRQRPPKAPEIKRDKSATEAKRQRRLLRKMLRNQKHISKAKKLVQNLTPGRESEARLPAALGNSASPLLSKLANPELETAFLTPALWPLTTALPIPGFHRTSTPGSPRTRGLALPPPALLIPLP